MKGFGFRIPLSHDHARLASKGAVAIRLASLIRAHGPTGVVFVRSDSNQIGVISGELALTSTLRNARLGRLNDVSRMLVLEVSLDLMKMIVSSLVGLDRSRQKNGSRAKGSLKHSGLHDAGDSPVFVSN